MRLSGRYGYREVRQSLQVESVDEPLRNSLWNALQVHHWDSIRDDEYGYRVPSGEVSRSRLAGRRRLTGAVASALQLTPNFPASGGEDDSFRFSVFGLVVLPLAPVGGARHARGP